MKVNKSAQVKGPARSQKWKDVRGRRSRPTATVTPAQLHSSPVMARMAKEHQATAKRKPAVKRLQPKARPVSDSKRNWAKSGARKPNGQANGSSAFSLENDSDDSQEWREYSRSALGNGQESSAGAEDGKPGRLEGEELQNCAERNQRHNCAVLVMQKDQTLCFRGKCFLSCLFGRVEVHGFTIEEGQQPYPLLSPASHCPLTVRALESPLTNRDARTEALPILRRHLSAESQKRLLKRMTARSSIVLLERMETPLTRFMSSLSELTELFCPTMSEMVSAVHDSPLNPLGVVPLLGAVEGMKISRSYRDALNTVVSACRGDLDGCAVILVCGTKNVGKSTFIRSLINTLLNHTTCVDYLECDLGQTEFTPAGCLSLSTVTEPLLGPPFTHQRTPEHMIYFGHTSCDSDLDRYLDSLKSLWRRRPQSRETPVVVNTMGWVKGFGFQLLVDLIRLLPVSHVVQLGHGGLTQCPPLTPDFLKTAPGCHTRPPAQTALDGFTEGQAPPKSYAHLLVQSEFEGVAKQGTSRHQRSNEQRDLSLLSYLSQLQAEDGPVQPLHSLTPYQVPHSSVALGVIHCDVTPKHAFYAANASLVALCCLGDKVASRGGGAVLLAQAPVCPCVGFGVLRGIDMARGLYFLLTPVDPSVLRKVNCLLLGAVLLPPCILTSQSDSGAAAPYLTADYSFDLSGAGKLRVFKGLTRPSQAGS